MTEEEKILEEFKALVYKESAKCSQAGWPNVCKLNASPKGQRVLLEEVFMLVSEEGMGIASAVAHVEMNMDERISAEDVSEDRS